MIGVDALALAQELVRCPSITPDEAGTLGIIENILTALGFECHRLRFGSARFPSTGDDATRVSEAHIDDTSVSDTYADSIDSVSNLYARRGSKSPNFCFAGHVDVVPPGDMNHWSVDPFAGVIQNGHLWGRGIADMKGSIAAFLTALERFLKVNSSHPGSISLLITSDEEGPAANGTRRVLAWLKRRQEKLDVCLLGEPTSPCELGEMIKIGRRGSLNARLTVRGCQGHSAYLQNNPAARLVRMLADLDQAQLDSGSESFSPSSVAITSIDVGNTTRNMTPASAQALFNVRFNDQHTPIALVDKLRTILARQGQESYDLETSCNSPCFLGASSELIELVCKAVEQVLGRRPQLSTDGGTSDGRFIKDFCPVVECGLTNATIHRVDERVPLADLYRLTDTYGEILKDYFA